MLTVAHMHGSDTGRTAGPLGSGIGNASGRAWQLVLQCPRHAGAGSPKKDTRRDDTCRLRPYLFLWATIPKVQLEFCHGYSSVKT